VKSSINIDILSSKRSATKPTYSVFNIKGQRVQSGVLNGANNKIDLMNISSGIYFINVADEKQQTTRKVLIVK
jgi:hypothetical protein